MPDRSFCFNSGEVGYGGRGQGMYNNRVENDNFFNPHYFLFCPEFTFSFKSPAKFFAEIQHCVLWEGNSNYTSYFEFSRVGIEDSESLSGFSCSKLIKAVSNYNPILCNILKEKISIFALLFFTLYLIHTHVQVFFNKWNHE